MNNSTSTCIASLPREILVKILSGLPAKSVVRFRCISKFFYSFIPEPHFAFRILVSISSRTCRINFYTVSYTEESRRKLQADIVPYLNVQRFKGLNNSSFADGKICLFSHDGEAAVCDLSTRQHISLPTTSVWSNSPTVLGSDLVLRGRHNYCETVSTCAVLGFDSVSKRYKVFKSESYCDHHFERMSTGEWVRVPTRKFSRQWVLTLGVDESWREINSFIHGHPSAGVHIDGIIYLILPKKKPNIVTFDVGMENFSMIHFSDDQFQPSSLKCSSWVNLNGRLAFINIYTKGGRERMDIWTLERSMEWEKHMVLIPLDESRLISHSRSMGVSTNSMEEIVFFVQGNGIPPFILLYAFRKQVWKKFKIRKLHDYKAVYGDFRSHTHFIEESVSF